MNKYYYVYIITCESNRVLYTGVTSDLPKQVFQHKTKAVEGFSKKDNLNRLVYYEQFEDINEAIKRKKQIKGGSRKKKETLINKINPERKGLFNKL